MEIEIVNQKENKLIERLEISAVINHQGEAVPKRESVLAKIAAQLNKERNQVVLIKMESTYGLGKSDALIHVYETAERAKLIERPYLLKRSGIMAAKEEN